MNIFETVLRTLFAFTVLLILTRIIGKKQLGQMNIFTYITGIAIGDMAAAMVLHKHIRMVEAITGLVLWCFLTIIVEYIGLKNIRARVLLNGEPAIVIKKGEIVEEELSKQRLNLDDLTMLLRTNQVFSILDVDYAILEANGDLSILKKPEKDIVTKQDLQLSAQHYDYLPSEIIVDGNVVSKNLIEFSKNQAWLLMELAKQNIDSASDVLYAELQQDGSLYIQKKK